MEPKRLKIESEEKKYLKINLLKENNSLTNRIKYKYKLNSIEEANLYLSNRIINCTPYYNFKKWEEDYQRSQYYKNNYCQLPVIDFKKYRKQNKLNKRKININNFNNKNSKSAVLSINRNYSSYDNLGNISIISKKNIDYISLNFFLNNKSLGEHSYIIITSLEEMFSLVTKKFYKTVNYLNKEDILGFSSEENNKTILLELDKTVKDNGLKDGSKIIVQFK